MTPELWQRVKPLFHAALEKEIRNRAAFVDAACIGDQEMKEQLERLLEAEARATGSLDAPLAHLDGISYGSTLRFQPGDLILKRFRIICPIGRGGMGEVYKAEDVELGVVALKTLRQDIASSPDAFERFRQEVQLARKVSGRHVCRIHELHLLPASTKHRATAFLTMEYLEGVTLYEKIHSGGPRPWKEIREIALEICEGLSLIHEQGIIHRDLKTSNIMLCNHEGTSRTVLMDFGLARNQSGNVSRSLPENTIPQMIVGTPAYMAPEQFEGKPVSPATDLYALGIILYELATGLHPYAAETPVAAAIRRAKHPLPPSSLRPNVPRQCDRIIEHCLEYEPEKRFKSADEIAKALRSGPANIENLRKDRPWIIWSASAIALTLLAGSLFFFWRSQQYYHPNPEASRWYDVGVAALREGNNVKATRSLQQALEQDNRFVMAHARLAQAWANLDFDGNAQRELLLATPVGRFLRPLDRMYIDAIHATVTKNFQAAIAIYRQILNRLPPNQKSSGYVDLGVAYERAGDPNHALENYAHAASLDNDNPAPFLHTAVLQSRQHHVPEAGRAFERAETLLRAEINQEGLAELDYARGVAANDNGRPAEAKQFVDRSLDEARRIPSVQLQIRDLVQLGVSTDRSDPKQAIEYVEQAIHLARENQLDAWAADGLVRLAGIELNRGNLQAAEDSVQDALQIAHQTQQLRAEAMANLTLASVMNQRHLPDKVIGPAQAALDFYQKNAYFRPAGSASVLLIRAKRDKGQYQEALKSGNAFLALATESGITPLMMQAEEVIGTVFLWKEEYPDALTHFRNAVSLADSSSRAYEALHTADTLWRLGLYSESDEMLNFLPANDRIAIAVGETREASLLSRGRNREAYSLGEFLIKKYPTMLSEDKQKIVLYRTVAEAHLGLKQQATKDLKSIESNQETDNLTENSTTKMAIAEASLAVGLPREAYEAATKAATYFASTGQQDSELHSVSLAAQAAKELKEPSDRKGFSAKFVDIVSNIQQTWSPQMSRTYLSRPDIQISKREM